MKRFVGDRLKLPAALCLTLVAAACGSSAQTSSSAHSTKAMQAGALATTQAVSAASTTTTTSTNRLKAAAAAKKAKSGSGGSQHKSSGTASTHTSAPSTTTTGSHTATSTHTTAASHTTAQAPTVHGLPSPEITATSGQVRGWLHAPDHAPTAGKKWFYDVLAADASGHPLSGTVDTQFALGGTVVGKESPPTHPLTQGRLHDGVTFPAQAEGIPLTFQIVIHTHLGSVTLDWPVKAHA